MIKQMIVDSVAKAKARTVFSFMIYAVYLILLLMNREIPPMFEKIVLGQMLYYYGERLMTKVKGVDV